MNHLIKSLLFAGLVYLPTITKGQVISDSETVNDTVASCDKGGFLEPSIIVNGDFSAGNTGFSTTYINCNTYNCLFPFHDEAYSVGSDAYFFHKYFYGYDHTTGSGNFMIINGQDSTRLVWGQTVPVVPYSKYIFSLWISAMNNLPAPGSSQIKVVVNGSTIGSVTSPTSTSLWTELRCAWNSGASTTATINIKDITSDWNGFDYGLDDISFRRCSVSKQTSGTANVAISKVVISPNPTDGVINLSNCPINSRIDIYDPIGKKVYSAMTKTTNSSVDMANLPNGLYFIQVSSAENGVSFSQRLLLNR